MSTSLRFFALFHFSCLALVSNTMADTITSTDVDLIIENATGSPVAEVTLDGVPTAPTVLALSIGTLTLPALVTEPTVFTVAAPAQLITVPSSPAQPSSSLPSANGTVVSPSASFNTSSIAASVAAQSTQTPSTSTSTSGFRPSFATSRLPTSTNSPSSTSTFSASGTVPTESSTLFVGGIGPASTTPSATPSSTNAVGVGGGDTGSSTKTVVGAVVGSVAGVVILACFAFWIFYKRFRRRAHPHEEIAPPGTAQSNAPMTHTPASLATSTMSLLNRMRPHSTATVETAPSERGFQKISGRKLQQSAFISGGDGFDDPTTGQGRGEPGAYGSYLGHERGDSGAQGNYIGPTDESVRVRPGPARTPQTFPAFTTVGSTTAIPRNDVDHPAYAVDNASRGVNPTPSSRSQDPSQFLRQPDPLGRSRPSHDGSRGSKFAEDLH